MSFKLKAAVSDAEGRGTDVDYDAAALTVSQAELQLPRLTTIRAYCSMAIDNCRELIAVAAPEMARRKYAENRKGTGTSE